MVRRRIPSEPVKNAHALEDRRYGNYVAVITAMRS